MKGRARWVVVAALGTTVLAFGVKARADAPASIVVAPTGDAATEIFAHERPTTRSFYGWEILATGEAGGVVAAAALLLPDSPLKSFPSTMAFLVGMPFYALGGPATHWTHGSFNKGLISLGANFALPIVGGFIGQSVHCVPSDHADDCGTRGFFTGFGVALVTVPLIDAIALGWEDIPDDDPLPSVGSPPAPGAGTPAVLPRPRAASFTILPAWSIGPKGELGFGMAGRF